MNSLVATVHVGSYPGTPAFDSTTGDLYVPNFNSANLTIISGSNDTIEANLYVGSNPGPPTFDPANGDVYVPTANNVSVISGVTEQVVGWIRTGGTPQTPVYDPTNGRLFVANEGSGNLSVINGTTNTILATIPVGVNPLEAAYDSLNGEVYVPNANGGNGRNISVISATNDTVTAIVNVTSSPLPGTLDATTGDLYFPLRGNYTVVSGSSNSVLGTSILRYDPQTPAFDPANGKMYFPQYLSSQTTAVFGESTSVTIQTGGTPVAPTYDPENGDIYVACEYNNDVSVISGTNDTVVATVNTGATPETPTYDSLNGKIYVANSGSNNVSVISGRVPFFPVVFNETGLPAGTEWSVTLNASTNRTSNSSVGFSVPEGVYSYSLSDVAGYHETAIAYEGHVTVLDRAVVEPNLAFVRVTYVVNFSEAGLPVGTAWSVSFAGDSNGSSRSVLGFSMPNGTGFGFSIGPVPRFVAAPQSGSLNVTGHAVAENVSFGPATPAPEIESFTSTPTSPILGSTINLSVSVAGGSPPLTFVYSGLPTGCQSSNASGLLCHPTATGSWRTGVTVTDALGREARANVSVTVTPGSGPISVSPSPETPSTLLGLPADEAYALVGAVAAAVLAAAVVLLWRRGRKPSVSA